MIWTRRLIAQSKLNLGMYDQYSFFQCTQYLCNIAAVITRRAFCCLSTPLRRAAIAPCRLPLAAVVFVFLLHPNAYPAALAKVVASKCQGADDLYAGQLNQQWTGLPVSRRKSEREQKHVPANIQREWTSLPRVGAYIHAYIYIYIYIDHTHNTAVHHVVCDPCTHIHTYRHHVRTHLSSLCVKKTWKKLS